MFKYKKKKREREEKKKTYKSAVVINVQISKWSANLICMPQNSSFHLILFADLFIFCFHFTYNLFAYKMYTFIYILFYSALNYTFQHSIRKSSFHVCTKYKNYNYLRFLFFILFEESNRKCNAFSLLVSLVWTLYVCGIRLLYRDRKFRISVLLKSYKLFLK